MKEEKLKSVPPLISQTTLRELGRSCSTKLGNDVYWLLNAVDELIHAYEEQEVKKLWEASGGNWDKLQKQLRKLHFLTSKTKGYFDMIEDKRFAQLSKEQEKKRDFIRSVAKISLIKYDLYKLLVLLIKNSTIQRQTIPSEAFKILEHAGYRKLTPDQRRPQEQTPTPPPTP